MPLSVGSMMANNTHVAAYPLIRLNEDEVPGAKFIYQTLEKHSKIQLQRWLACRGLVSTGTRAALLKRVENCITAGEEKHIDIAVDGGKWFQMKLGNIQQAPTLQVPVAPIQGWKIFPSTITIPPNYNYGHIHHHIVESVQIITQDQLSSDDDGDTAIDLHTAKPLVKGKRFFTSGHVTKMQDAESASHYFVKAKVMASYKTNKLYDTTCSMSKASGFIVDASCICESLCYGEMQSCVCLVVCIVGLYKEI